MSVKQTVLMEMLQEGTLCDTVLTAAGDVRFKAHRIILCGCSPFFRDMFCNNPPEQRVLSFPDVNPDIMQLILEFVYSRSAVVREDNVQQLLAGAHRLSIINLVQACCCFLLEKLCSNNCISTWMLAQQYQYAELMEKAHQYIMQHFEEVAGASAEFLQLSLEQLAALLEEDGLNVKQESSVIEAVIQWIDFHLKERRGHMALLLSKVRLLLLPTDYLLNNVSKHTLVRNNPPCVDIITSTMKTLHETNIERPLARTRLPPQYLLAIGGFEDSLPTDKIDFYNVRNNSWLSMYKSGEAIPEFCSSVYLSGNIYYIGGLEGTHYLSSVKRFNLATKTWKEVGSMHKGRIDVSLVILDGCIYAMGGRDDDQTHASAERFDPNTNQWTLIAPMQERRADAGSTTLHRKIYICGGLILGETLFTAEFYNLDTDQWTNLPVMDSPRSAAGVIAYNNQIFVIGGYNDVRPISDVLVYNPGSGNWHTVAPMLHCRSNFGVEVLEGQLYVVGGFHNNKEDLCQGVERYNGQTDTWENVEDIEAPRGALSCCVVERFSHTHSFVL